MCIIMSYLHINRFTLDKASFRGIFIKQHALSNQQNKQTNKTTHSQQNKTETKLSNTNLNTDCRQGF